MRRQGSDTTENDTFAVYDKGRGSAQLRRTRRSVPRKADERQGARAGPAFEFKDVGNGPDLAGFARQVRVTTVGAAAMHDELGVDVLGRRFGEKEARNALDILWRENAQHSVVETLSDQAERNCRH